MKGLWPKHRILLYRLCSEQNFWLYFGVIILNHLALAKKTSAAYILMHMNNVERYSKIRLFAQTEVLPDGPINSKRRIFVSFRWWVDNVFIRYLH